MINLKTVLSTLTATFVIAGVGFFIDFQFLKGKVDVIASEVVSIRNDIDRIEEVKDVQCEMALYILKDKNDKILRICR